MKELCNFLKVLQDKKVDKTYNKVKSSLEHLKSSLSSVNEEVNDTIINLAIEGKYSEIDEFTRIPYKAEVIISNIDSILSGKMIHSFNNESKENKNYDLNNKGKTGLVVKNNKQVEHKDYGIGTVIGAFAQKDSNSKLLRVVFDCGEKQFECSDDILVNNFGLNLNDINNTIIIENEEKMESDNNTLKVGTLVRHKTLIPIKSYGIGKVISIENKENSRIKLVTVKFDCGEKKFQGNKKTLSTYFEIVSDSLLNEETSKSDELIKSDELLLNNNECNFTTKKGEEIITSDLSEVNNERGPSIKSDEGYSLYTNPEFFIGKKPLKVRIFDEEKEVETWTDLCLELYDYLLAMNERVFYEVTDEIQGFGSLSQFMSNPIQIRRDLYFNRAGTKGMIKQMYYVSEKFSKHIEQDICENVRLFIK